MIARFGLIWMVGFVMLILSSPGTAGATSFGLFGTSPPELHLVKTALPGEQFDISVWVKLETGDSLSQFSMTATWNVNSSCAADDAELTYNSSAEFASIDGGKLTTDANTNQAGNSATFLASAGSGTGVLVGPDVFQVGTITFTVDNPITDGLDACLGPGPIPWLDGSGNPITPAQGVLEFGDLDVRPIPSTATENRSWGSVKRLFR